MPENLMKWHFLNYSLLPHSSSEWQNPSSAEEWPPRDDRYEQKRKKSGNYIKKSDPMVELKSPQLFLKKFRGWFRSKSNIKFLINYGFFYHLWKMEEFCMYIGTIFPLIAPPGLVFFNMSGGRGGLLLSRKKRFFKHEWIESIETSDSYITSCKTGNAHGRVHTAHYNEG